MVSNSSRNCYQRITPFPSSSPIPCADVSSDLEAVEAFEMRVLIGSVTCTLLYDGAPNSLRGGNKIDLRCGTLVGNSVVMKERSAEKQYKTVSQDGLTNSQPIY